MEPQIKAWEINKKVKEILVSNWVDTLKLSISTIRDTVFIKGQLAFRQEKVSMGEDVAVINVLKRLERGILRVPGVKRVKWNLEGWQNLGGRWFRGKKK